MARWTPEEIATLVALGLNDWAGFHQQHPDRSYDAWEVKRRRLAGGSAGMGRVSKASVRLDFAAVQALGTLARFVEARVGR